MAHPKSNLPSAFLLQFSVFAQPSNSHNLTIYSFLQRRLARCDIARLDEYFNCGCITVNGKKVSAEEALFLGDEVMVHLPEHREGEVSTDWQLLWENDELMAIYKPPLLPVSRTTRNLYNTLISLVRRETEHTDAHLLHRLDAETSGVILLAKNKVADKKWKGQLNQLIRKKVYHASVYGQPEWKTLTFESLLSEKEGSLIRSQMHVVDTEQLALFRKPKLSKTTFKVLGRTVGQGLGQNADQSVGESVDQSLIECELHTGRKHQIRAQLAHLGHPIIGDKIYAYDGYFYLQRLERLLIEKDYVKLGSVHQQLVAYSVELLIEGELITITVPEKGYKRSSV